MRKFIASSALLLFATGASAVEVTDDFIGQLSSQEYETYLVLEEDSITCEEHTSHNTYIPVNWASVNLKLAPYDRHQVLSHSLATMHETQSNGNPETLCGAVQSFVDSLDASQTVMVTKTIDVHVALVPRYGGGCERELIEQITVRLTDRLVLKATNMRVLSGGSDDRDDCLRLPPIFH